MKPLAILILLGLLGAVASTTRGELAVVPTSEPVRVLAGAARTFPVIWKNTDDKAETADLRLRLLQASSATVAPVGEWPWKKLQVLPGQTVLEHATLDFPEVKAETRFLVQWMEGTNRIIGTTDVLVYPTNLLADLKSLAGEEHPVGLFDPANTLKPLLKPLAVGFEDLEDTGIANFHGQLALIGPFTSREHVPSDMADRVEQLARKGVPIVWLQPPPEPHEKLQPSFRTVQFGDTAVVVAQAQLVANLVNSPQSQLNLLHLCRVALNPERPQLPHPQPQP